MWTTPRIVVPRLGKSSNYHLLAGLTSWCAYTERLSPSSGPVLYVLYSIDYTIPYILDYTLLYYAILCYTILCYAMLYYTMLYYAMLCYTILHYATLGLPWEIYWLVLLGLGVAFLIQALLAVSLKARPRENMVGVNMVLA